MSEDAQREYLTNRITKELVKTDPDFKCRMPNQAFKIPEREVYGEFFILGGKGFTAAGRGEGQIIDRYPNMIQLTVHSPESAGTKKASQIIDAVKPIFEHHRGRDKAGSNYVFRTSETRHFDPNKGFWTSILRIPFHRDEFKTINS